MPTISVSTPDQTTCEQLPIDILVIGAGVSGLSTAYHLTRSGQNVLVLEAAERLGGVIGTQNIDGWQFETGPNTLMRTPALNALLSELDLEVEAIAANEMAKKRFVVKNGHPVALPGGPLELLTSTLFGLGDLFHLAREPWIKPAATEETIAQFVRRRLGQGFLDWAVDPFVSGVYAGDPERLSVRAATPQIYALEQAYGSLIRGGLAKMKARKLPHANGTPPEKKGLISFPGGMGMLIDRLADRIRESKQGRIQTTTSITTLTQTPEGIWQATAADGSQFQAKQVVLAIPAAAAARLVAPLNANLADLLSTIEYPPVTAVVLGFDRQQVAHPLNGFGMLIPGLEKRQTLGVLFSSTLFAHRAPADKVLLTAFIGGRRRPEAAEGDDDTLIQRVQADLSPLLGIQGSPEFAHIQRWSQAIPQYELGYLERLQTIDAENRALPGLHLSGNWRTGIAVGDCLVGGATLAQTISRPR